MHPLQIHMTTEEVLKETAGQLHEIINAKNVMGDAVDLGNRMIIPVTKFGIGFGAGGGFGDKGNTSAGGAGGGIEPVAVIITDKTINGVEGIQIVSLKNNNPIAQVITSLSETLVPQVIDFIKKKDTTEKPSQQESEPST